MRKENSEQGSAALVSMVLSLAIVLGLQEYWPIIAANLKFPFQILLLVLCSFFVFVTLLVGLYKILSGEKNSRQMKRIIRKEIKKLKVTVSETKEKLSELNAKVKYTSSIMNPRGFEELETMKGLIHSLESRITSVNKLIQLGGEENICKAYNIMFDDVSVYGSSLTGLILSDSNALFSYDHVAKELEKRLVMINHYLPTTKQKRARVATV